MTFLPEWFRKLWDFAGFRGLRILALIIFAAILIRVLRALTRRLIRLTKSEHEETRQRRQRVHTLAGLVFSLGAVLILGLTSLEILRELGFDVTPIAAAAGLASLALGFGAQNVVRDFINGFVIVFEDQFAVGDLIRINDVTGRVTQVTLRRTVIQTDLGALVTIPNGLIGQVANLNRVWYQENITIAIAPDENVTPALTEIESALKEFSDDPAWGAAVVEPPRILGVESVSTQCVILAVAARCVPGRQADVARELRRRIRVAFEESGIRMTEFRRIDSATESNSST